MEKETKVEMLSVHWILQLLSVNNITQIYYFDLVYGV
jgi:hypothetical protein